MNEKKNVYSVTIWQFRTFKVLNPSFILTEFYSKNAELFEILGTHGIKKNVILIFSFLVVDVFIKAALQAYFKSITQKCVINQIQHYLEFF